jgi:hypothetical protein
MQRRSLLVFCLAASLPAVAAAEEISLKDGTKIIGHMTSLTGDKIEVETSYGKMQLKRTDIVAINFPENGPAPSSASSSDSGTAAKADSTSRLVDESLQGARYLNRTGKFSLTLPQDWVINTDVHRNPETLTVLSSRDKTRFLMVMQEEYPGSLESYKDLTMLAARKNLNNYEELAQSNVTIDGKAALMVFYRGNSQKGGLPMEFVSAIFPSGNGYSKMTVWCVEPLFHDMQPTFEKLLSSYRNTGQITASGPSSKP